MDDGNLYIELCIFRFYDIRMCCYGLLNIQNAAKKYNGDMELIKKQEEAIDFFILQIMLQNPFTS